MAKYKSEIELKKYAKITPNWLKPWYNWFYVWSKSLPHLKINYKLPRVYSKSMLYYNSKAGEHMKESKYQEMVLDYLEKRGAWCFTSHGGSMYQVAGLPDVIGVYKGVFLGLELKTGSYQATDLQKQKLNNIQDAGGVGLILRDDLALLDTTLHYIDTHGIAPKQQKYKVNLGVIFDE